jgi:DNA-binding transcriptional ArsR family regulator
MRAPKTASLFKALGDPTRLAVFERLTEGEAPVKALTQGLGVSQPAVSQHLAALKEAGLVTVRRDGRLMLYGVKPNGLKPLLDWLAHYKAFWPGRIDRLKALLDRMDA